jgi:type IV secretory pathway VirB6-like protein
MAMLYGPMTCVFASKFVASIEALITTGFYGWILALLIVWGLVEFTMMILGAIITYVKAIVGLTFLFGIAPIFMSFFLFEKTRTLTEGWMNMVIAYALQPVMLFAFLAVYATIVGDALTNMFTDSSGSSEDICYVPWYTMSGLFHIYWMRFANAASAAGGQWISAKGGSGNLGSGIGAVASSPVQVLNILYFLVLSNLGKSFTNTINEISDSMAGGQGPGIVPMQRIGSWFKKNITGGRGPIGSAAAVAGNAAKAMVGTRGSID